jgi:hypothetical protein
MLETYSAPKSFLHATYAVLIMCMASGVAAIPFGPRIALIPAAVMFGWAQTGGL